MELFGSSSADTLTVGKYEVIIGPKISEGGYALVYKVSDVSSGEIMALK
jgi:serine/threonine protein kinase